MINARRRVLKSTYLVIVTITVPSMVTRTLAPVGIAFDEPMVASPFEFNLPDPKVEKLPPSIDTRITAVLFR